LAAQGKKVRVGMEASGHARWFERLLACWGPSARVNNFETHDLGIY
jgi:hypothetical protein